MNPNEHAALKAELMRILEPVVDIAKIEALGGQTSYVADRILDLLPPAPSADAQPSAAKCADCGTQLNAGTAKVFTVCDACWAKAYPASPAQPSALAGETKLTDEQADNLLALLDYDVKLGVMTPRQLIFEVMGSRAADFRCVVALMDRVLPNWQDKFTDEETENGSPSTERFEPIKASRILAASAQRVAELEAQLAELKASTDYAIHEKDKHGRYWHDLAQQRIASLSHAETQLAAVTKERDEALFQWNRNIKEQEQVYGLLTSKLAALRSRAAQGHAPASEDTARLNWLTKTEHDVVFETGDPEVGVFSAWQVWKNAKRQTERPLMVSFDSNLRSAIDAARAGGRTP